MTENYVHNTIFIGMPQSYRIPMECRTNSKSTSFVKDFTFGLNLSYDVTWPVFNRLKGFRERAKTWMIQLSRCLHTQCLMRTYRIIDISPIIKFSLTVRKVMKRVISQYFHFQCSMKAFIISPSSVDGKVENNPHKCQVGSARRSSV